MATMTDTLPAVDTTTPSHDYHAEAHVLSGHLRRPVEQKIEQHAPVAIQDRRGGHLTRLAEEVSIEGLISFTKGKTRVSGSRSLKTNGWVTLSTSILEGLNVFEIITADRIVSQVSTEHPFENGHVPHVTFLGTKFTNLQVSGFPLKLTLDFGICGKKPDGDSSYLEDPGFLNGVKAQAERISKADGLPKEIKDQYHERLTRIDDLIRSCNDGKQSRREPITCSLVQSIGEIPIPGVQSFGHILMIPEFGIVSLGEVEVGERVYDPSDRPNPYFELTCVKMRMGCVGHGTALAATATANGAHKP